MDIEALRAEKLTLRQSLNYLHDQIVPLESQLKHLTSQYEQQYKQYLAVDRKLAKLDGRFKQCRPHTSGRKQPNHQNATKVLTQEQLDALIAKLEAEIEAKEKQG
jgi:hypothetical protein